MDVGDQIISMMIINNITHNLRVQKLARVVPIYVSLLPLS